MTDGGWRMTDDDNSPAGASSRPAHTGRGAQPIVHSICSRLGRMSRVHDTLEK
jgi:hypothetical protein